MVSFKRRFPFDLRVPLYLVLNFFSCTTIVCINKVIFNSGFTHGTVLTIIHFIITFLGLCLAIQLKLLVHKPLSVKSVAILSVTYSGFVSLTNLSLVYSSLGFNQLKKVLNTPVMLFIEYVFQGKRYSKKVIAALTLVVVGVASATVTDPRNSVWGTVLGLTSIMVGAANQILVGSKPKELECNALQLLLYQAPISAVMLLPTIPIFDLDIWNFTMPSPSVICLILLSSFCALGVNTSIFLVIGSTSPLTYNVFGQVKIVSLLAADFIFFAAPWDPKVISGILVTLTGVFWYSYLRTKQQQHQQAKSIVEQQKPGTNPVHPKVGNASCSPSNLVKPLHTTAVKVDVNNNSKEDWESDRNNNTNNNNDDDSTEGFEKKI